MAISLRKARMIIRKALEKGREMELKPLSVVVLDAGGHVQAFEREDGASPGRFAIAHGKAYGVGHAGHGGHGADGAGRRAGLFHGRDERALRRPGRAGAGRRAGARQAAAR